MFFALFDIGNFEARKSILWLTIYTIFETVTFSATVMTYFSKSVSDSSNNDVLSVVLASYQASAIYTAPDHILLLLQRNTIQRAAEENEDARIP